MGTRKEEIIAKVQPYILAIKNKDINPKELEQFIKIIEKRIISLMKYFGMNEQEIEEQFSEFIYNLILTLPKLKDDSKFYSFVFGFIRNSIRNYYKRKRKLNWISIEEFAKYNESNIEDDNFNNVNFNFSDLQDYDLNNTDLNIKELISYGLENLDKIYSETLYMFYFEEKKINEIAEILHCSESCVKLRLKRGKEKLAKIISKKLN